MKKMKRLAALFLAVVMVMAMGMTAFAAPGDPQTITLKIDAKAGHTYTVYQLLTGTVAEDGVTLSNVNLGSSAGNMTVEYIENSVKDKNGVELSQKAVELVDGKTSVYTIAVTEDGEQTVKINGSTSIPAGYYVITDAYTGGRPGDGVDTTLSATMVQLVVSTTIHPKDSKIPDQPTKEVKGGTTTVSIGDEVTYTLGGTIPSMDNYEKYIYVLVDTLAKGLKPNVNVNDTRDVDLVKNGATVGTAKLIVTKVDKKTDGTTEVRFALDNAINYSAATYTGATFTFDYSATVTADADLSGNVNPLTNKVEVQFPNSPDEISDGDGNDKEDLTGKTVDTTVTVYTTRLVINKVDGTDVALAGAEFQIDGASKNVGYVTGQKYVEAENGTWYKLANGSYTETAPVNADDSRYDSTTKKYTLQNVNEATYTTAQKKASAFVENDGDNKGKVEFDGLGEGTYTITELTTPDGYNAIEPITVRITFNNDTDNPAFSAVEVKANGQEVPIDLSGWKIVNQAGVELPSTGGIGTTIFYVVGGILVLGAGVLLITKKRMSARD